VVPGRLSGEEQSRRIKAGLARSKAAQAARVATSEEAVAERRRRVKAAARTHVAKTAPHVDDIAFDWSAEDPMAATMVPYNGPHPLHHQPQRSAVRPPPADCLATLIVETVACRHVLEEIRELLRPPPRLGPVASTGDLKAGAAQLASNRGRHGAPGGPLIGIGESSYSPSDAREIFGSLASVSAAAVGVMSADAPEKISGNSSTSRFNPEFAGDGTGAALGYGASLTEQGLLADAYDHGVWSAMANEVAAEDEPAVSAVAPAGVEDRLWEGRLAFHRANRMWVPEWGPEPGKEGCLVPGWLLGGER
jgi:hypothetical protein